MDGVVICFPEFSAKNVISATAGTDGLQCLAFCHVLYSFYYKPGLPVQAVGSR